MAVRLWTLLAKRRYTLLLVGSTSHPCHMTPYLLDICRLVSVVGIGLGDGSFMSSKTSAPSLPPRLPSMTLYHCLGVFSEVHTCCPSPFFPPSLSWMACSGVCVGGPSRWHLCPHLLPPSSSRPPPSLPSMTCGHSGVLVSGPLRPHLFTHAPPPAARPRRRAVTRECSSAVHCSSCG